MGDPTSSRFPQLLAELKRRKVFRVAAVYGGSAFVVLQAADLLFPRLGLPDWTVTLVVALSVLGLPVALALAWALESTPDGLRVTAPPAPDELDRILSQPRRVSWLAGMPALAGVALLAWGGWLTLSATEASTYDSIAVLPFSNLGGGEEEQYFGDGLAEELISALSGIRELRVAAATSTFAFRGRSTDARVIGDTLGVATVLDGGVRRSGNRIRITAQLIDARTGFQIWSEAYDRPLDELFTVQEAIAAEILSALGPRLNVTDRTELYRGGTEDVAAYDLYLLGRQKWTTREVPLLREAVAHFEAAIARDSSFALAWSGLADALDALAYRATDALPRVPEAMAAAQYAILLEPDLAEGWASWGVLVGDFDRDWRKAELALRRAVELKPSYSQGYAWLTSLLNFSGRVPEALEFARRARELDPIGISANGVYGETLQFLGRWEETRSFYEQTELGFPGRRVVYAREIGLDEQSAARDAREFASWTGYDRPDQAEVLGRAMFVPSLRDSASVVLSDMEAKGNSLRELAMFSAAIGDAAGALARLERAMERGDPLLNIGVEPVLDALRTDPRLLRILSQLGLPNCDASCRTGGAPSGSTRSP